MARHLPPSPVEAAVNLTVEISTVYGVELFFIEYLHALRLFSLLNCACIGFVLLHDLFISLPHCWFVILAALISGSLGNFLRDLQIICK